MANLDHINIFTQGVEVWDRWREEHPEIMPDLSGKIFLKDDCWPSDKNLVASSSTLQRGIDFSYSNLSGTKFHGFYFAKATFFHANLSGAKFSDVCLTEASFRNANLSKAEIIRCNLEYSDLRDADLTDSILDGCGIFGIASWGVKGVPKNQFHLRITKDSESDITVSNLEIARFISLVLKNEKIKDFIETTTSKFVLIVGRFNGRKKILDAIWNELWMHNYLPVLFEFKKPSSRDLSETILTLAGMARFIIADITDPHSVPDELRQIAPVLPSVPVKPLLQKGHKAYALFNSIQRHSSVLPIFEYENVDSILADFKRDIIEPAEIKAKELQALS
jgi:hypothetical protein